MARLADHQHRWAIIAHTITKRGKEVRVLLGCQSMSCGGTKQARPKQNVRVDPEFWSKVRATEHRCCHVDLGEYEGTEVVSAA